LYAVSEPDKKIAGGIQFNVRRVVKELGAEIQPVYHVIVEADELTKSTAAVGQPCQIKLAKRTSVLAALNAPLALTAHLTEKELSENATVIAIVMENEKPTTKRLLAFTKIGEENTRYWVSMDQLDETQTRRAESYLPREIDAWSSFPLSSQKHTTPDTHK